MARRPGAARMSGPGASVECMFDSDRRDSVFAAISPPADVAASPAEPAGVPLERVEAQICELAGHLAAATCRFLVLLADFDARRGWASWEMGSCAQWLSWKCQMSSGTAREHVRVARALRDLPVIRARFAAGRLSYAKVRALTRIATPATEAGLAELAGPMTANQLERFARAHRQVTRADDAEARVRRRLAWRVEEDGSLSGTFRLPPLQGAVLLKALRAACAGLAGDPRAGAETPAADALAADEPPPAPAPPQLRDPPRRPGAGRLPVPVPGLRVPPDRPAPHPALGQRRPHRPGQPGQPLPLPPQAGPRPRLPHRRPARRHLRVLPPGRHPAAAQPAPARTRRPDRPHPRRRDHPGHDHPALVRRAPRPEPTSKNKPTGSRPRSRSSGRTHVAATSATRPTTSAAITTNTRPPDSPALYACFADQDGSVSCLSVSTCVAVTDNGVWVTSDDGGLTPAS